MESQFKRGILELCVLGLLYKKDCYGYELVEETSKVINTSNGTLYPLLRRLQKEEYLEYYTIQSKVGPARKYYTLTKKGISYFKEQKDYWIRISSSVNKFLNNISN